MEAVRTSTRLKAHPDTVKQRRAVARRACRCNRKGTLGDYVDVNTLADDSSGPNVGDMVGMGSFLSKAFRRVTGVRLSNVVAPIASVVGGAIGGPVGAAIGGAIGGVDGGAGGGTATGGGTIAQNSLAPSTQTSAMNINDIFGGIQRVLLASHGTTPTALKSAASDSAAVPKAAASSGVSSPSLSAWIDQNKPVVLIGGALLAGYLLTKGRR